MDPKAYQKKRMGLEELMFCQWSPWRVLTVGNVLQYTASTFQTAIGRMIPQMPYPNKAIEMTDKTTVVPLRGMS